MKTTEEMFAEYSKECLRLQKILNLLNWSMYFELRKLNDSVAQCEANSAGCVATLVLNADGGKTPINPKECASHEMWHLFLWRIQEMISKKMTKIEKKELDQEIERLVCVLEKLKIVEEPVLDHTKDVEGGKVTKKSIKKIK